MKEKFDIKGMSCSACSSKIQNKMDNTQGVIKPEVNLLTNSMQVEFDENTISVSDIVTIVKGLGYGASVKNAKEQTVPKKEESESRVLLRRFIISLCFMIPLMYVSM